MTALQLVDKLTGEVTQEAPTFADFWLLYPRRVARKDALKAWDKLTPTAQVDAVVGLAEWRKVWLRRDEMEYVPYPATWLNGERWEDELPPDPQSNHASHAPAELPDSAPRTSMPEHVRALLAKLRGR